MEPVTTSRTTTKINTQQVYPQQRDNRKSRIVAESSNNSSSDIEGQEENRVLPESGDILPISPMGEDSEVPFLIVSLRASKNSPPRPKNVSYLYMIAILDLSIVTVCTILLVYNGKQDYWHWRKAAWDWAALGLIRFIIVVGIASSKWIRELRWVLGGVCCFSSLYIIFKANLIFQYKKQIDKYHLILLISSFLFCQMHWIAHVVVTTDSLRKEKYLRNQSVYFEEESRHSHVNIRNEDALNNINSDISSPSTLRSYGATANRDETETSALVSDESN